MKTEDLESMSPFERAFILEVIKVRVALETGAKALEKLAADL